MAPFRLQAVLEYRKTIEEKMLILFSEAARCLDAEKSKLDVLEQEKGCLVNDLKDLQEKAVQVENIALLADYIGVLQIKRNRQREVVCEVAMELDKKRRELTESVQKRKMLEKLKERHVEDDLRNRADDERKRMDEMAITRFIGIPS